MNFGFLLFPLVEELDFAGPWEIIRMWSKHLDGPDHCFTVAALEPILCAKGLSINPDMSFDTCPQLDYMLVPGGQGTRVEVGNRALVDFVANQATTCRAVLSVCTGSFILHAAGLLAGKRATTHWGSLERLREFGDVEVVEERFVRDADIWSSAGVSAGTDLALAFVESVAGAETAGKVQLAVEYYPSTIRYGHPADHERGPAYLRMPEEEGRRGK